MKTKAAPIQRCACGKKHAPKPAPARGFEPEPVQRKSAGAERGFDEAAVHPGVLRPPSGGAPLPGAVQRKMEAAFGHDFSAVRIHHGAEAESIGAVAYARGTHLHFAPGRYQPHSAEGQRLLGHELAHVVQQRAGRVARPGGAVPINADPALEREADAAGARAAAAQSAGLELHARGGGSPGGGAQRGTASAGPAIQPMFGIFSRSAKTFEPTVKRVVQSALTPTHFPQFPPIFLDPLHAPRPAITSTSVRRFATMPEFPQVPKPKPKPKPRPKSKSRPKLTGPMANLMKSMRKTGVSLTGAFQSGLVPKNKDYHASMQEAEDYTGKREPQVLSQFSELLLHHMETKHGHREVEVQLGHGDEDGKPRIFASANSAKGQELLRGSTANMDDVVKTAVQSTDEHIRRVGNKLMYFPEQQAQRRANAEKITDPAKRKQEMDSIAAADVLHAHIMGGGIEPVGGVGGVHAEQVVDAGMRKAGVEPKAIFGSKIRCASCSSMLGSNRTVDGVEQIGRVYPRQVGPGKAESTLRAIGEGRAKIVTNRTKRSRSLSPSARQAPIEAVSGTSGPLPGSEAEKADEPRGRSRLRGAPGRGRERAPSAPLPHRDAREDDERRGRSLTRTPSRR